MSRIDLNCDLGESYGKFSSAYDRGIMPFISSCNIAAGFHSGDPDTIQETIKLALEHEVAIGVHPSFPDLQGFGRRIMHLQPDELTSVIRYQIAAVKGMTEALGGTLHHIKPHGALYNLASADEATSKAVLRSFADWLPDLVLYAPWNSVLAKEAEKAGVTVAFESFADRRYESDHSLRSRSLEGAVLSDQQDIIDQVSRLINDQKVRTQDGKVIEIKTDTICLHSDTSGALELCKAIHEYLTDSGVDIRAF